MSLGYRGVVPVDFLRQASDQSALPRAVFLWESGELIYRNESFLRICGDPEIATANEFLGRLQLEKSTFATFEELRDSWTTSTRTSEHLGSLVDGSGKKRWVWVHFENTWNSDGIPTHISVVVYVYYSGPPPLHISSESVPQQAREYLSHDLNSMFMALSLAVENLGLSESQARSFYKILNSSQKRKDELIERVLTPFEHPEGITHAGPRSEIIKSVDASLPWHRLATHSRTRLSVLVVEDDDDLREHIHLGLSRRGHSCISTSTGDEALAAVSDHGQPNVALIDLRLGNEDGRDICDKLLNKYPGMTAVFMTGFANWAAVASLESQQRVLRKPFTITYLESTLSEAVQENQKDPHLKASPKKESVGIRDCHKIVDALEQAMFIGDAVEVQRLISDCFVEDESLSTIYRSLIVPVWQNLAARTGSNVSSLFKLHRARWLTVRSFTSAASIHTSHDAQRGTVVVGGVVANLGSSVPCRLLSEILRSQGFAVSDIGFFSTDALLTACSEPNDLSAVCIGPWSPETHAQTRDAVLALRSKFGSTIRILVGSDQSFGPAAWSAGDLEPVRRLKVDQVIDDFADDFVRFGESFESANSNRLLSP